MRTTEVYDRFGDAYYRAMETMILIELQSREERSVIVLGSGLALMPKNAG
jgi:shikimate kinase